ncbi:MAG: CoB--CoM heterodisulfide reductase iron-sulfur subunit B family protein [Syntrophobacteraceae bacterium]|nr:CoB--CoM heterodisulfide reductase iron-sulfur subunit B family protein [Syntrophobacteraceae bacterium]
MKRVAYYKGCSLEGLAAEYDRSTRMVCEAFGIELVEIPDWNCCGSTPAHSYDPLLSAALAGRNLAIAADNGCDMVMSPCPGCLKSLKGAQETCEDPAQRKAFVDLVGRDVDGLKTVSLLQLLYEEVGPQALQKAVRRPLTGHVLVPYYGCLLTRPAEKAKFDDPENPISMDRLIEATGATVPRDFPYKTECCGATYGVTRNDFVGKLSGRILDMSQGLGAEAIVVACPLCQQNLDMRQDQINKYSKSAFHLPVPYISQVIGLALGIEPKVLGLDKLCVPADILLEDRSGEDGQARQPGGVAAG